jgi:hypothetical protein
LKNVRNDKLAPSLMFKKDITLAPLVHSFNFFIAEEKFFTSFEKSIFETCRTKIFDFVEQMFWKNITKH